MTGDYFQTASPNIIFISSDFSLVILSTSRGFCTGLDPRLANSRSFSSYTADLSSSLLQLPVTRANPAKNYSANVFKKSAVSNLFSLSILLSLTEATNWRKSLIIARSRGDEPSSRGCAPVLRKMSTAPCLSERSSTRATHLLKDSQRGHLETGGVDRVAHFS